MRVACRGMTDALPLTRHRYDFNHPMAPAVVLAFTTCMTQFDVTAAAVALPEIRAELGFGAAGLAWVMDAYSLAFAGLLFLAGALADRFGRRRMLMLGNAGFALASLFCGLAWDGPSLWIARALQGGASAFVITGSFASLSLCYPPSDGASRARAFGIIGVTGGAAMALGPTLGGLVAAGIGWRWIFLVNLPLCALNVWLILRVVTESKDQSGRPLDPAGVALLTLALALPVQAILQDGAAWQRGALVLAGIVCGGALLLQQRKRTQPMLDPALFTRGPAIGIAILLICLSLGYWAVLVYLPLWLQTAYGLDTQQAGFAMLASTLPMLVLPPAGVWLIQRYGWRATFAGGLAMLAAGGALLALTGVQKWDLSVALAAMTVAAAGAGISNPQVSGALVALVRPDQAGMASAMATVLRQASYAVGIALFGVLIRGDSFAPAFAAAALAAFVGAVAATLLLPRRM